MDQFAQSVVYSHDQERKKEKWTIDSVEWNPILAFATKNSLAREKKKNRKNVIYNSALIVTARSEKNLGSYHFRATEKIILTKICRRTTFAKGALITRYKVRPSALKLCIMIVAAQFTRHIHDVSFQNETRTNPKEDAGSNTVDRNSYREAFQCLCGCCFLYKDQITFSVRLKLVQSEVGAAAEDGGSSICHVNMPGEFWAQLKV